MKVSVVIPTYNRAFDLSKLLDCLLKQTTKPFELIIIDDNTPNKSIKNLCELYRTSFKEINCALIYARNQRENSVAICRNLGVKLSSGDIVMFFDDDILIYEHFIEKILEVFKMHEEALGVQGWVPSLRRTPFPFRILHTIIFGPSMRDRNRFLGTQYPTVLTQVINCESLCGGAMTLRRKVFDEFAFDETLKKQSFMEDDLFSYSIFQKYPNALFMTPFARAIHKKSQSARTANTQTQRLEEQYRRYVFVKLFGKKGNLLYFWQNIGFSLERTITNLARRYKTKA
jgi:glycosyltransferase involved in cell wall biosynthesis